MIEVCPLPNGCDADWDDFVRQNHEYPLFCESAWIECFNSVFAAKPRRHVAIKDDRFVGGIITFERSRSIWNVSVPFPFSLYNGIILPPSPDDDVTKSLFLYVRKTLHFASLSVAKQYEKWVQAEDDWSVTACTSRKLRLDSPEKIWENYSQSLRRKIRKAQDSKLTCFESSDQKSLIELHLKSYARHDLIPPFDRSQLFDLLKRLNEKSFIRLFHAKRVDGTVSAARAIALHGTQAYDLLAGSDPTIPNDVSSHFLVHSILARLSKEGFSSFDFMGTNTPGVRDFKMRFGGEDVSYVQAVYYRNAFIRGADTINSFLHRFARRVR